MTEPPARGSRPVLAAVVAMASNRVIGREGGLPWRLPEDLKWFRRLTLGGTVIMGRRTWESLPVRPLPRRRCIVVSRSLAHADDAVVVPDAGPSLDAALQRTFHPDRLPESPPPFPGRAFVIGGARLFADLLPRCGEIFLTCIHAPHEGDTFMPPFEDEFARAEVIESGPQFEIARWARRDDRAAAEDERRPRREDASAVGSGA